jgi:probable F420-dependent oxidoreductase
MKIGIQYFPTDYSMSAVATGRALEERGFESLWIVEHTHIPASRKTPHPFLPELPDYYIKSYEPFTFLAQVAAVTQHLKVATGICLVPEHHPLALAKRVASLDSLSNGRFLFGVGAGWNAEELRNHGIDFDQRWHVLKDYVLAMKTCWTESDAEYHGAFVDFDPVWVEPKPVTKPYPPIYIGASSRYAIKRVVDFGDGWLPHYTPDFADLIAQLDQTCIREGRDRSSIDICVVLETVKDAKQLESLKNLGVNRVVFCLPTVPESQALSILDEYAVALEWATQLGGD